MKQPIYTNQFAGDVKRNQRRGKDMERLKTVIRLLLKEELLDERLRDHALTGNYKGRRECHIEPDWLLIYKLQDDSIIFERTGTHADLFR